MSIIVKKAVAVVPKDGPKKLNLKEEFRWVPVEDGFEVKYPNDNSAKLKKSGDNRWQYSFTWENHEIIGTRDTLEEAFKTVDKLVYYNSQELWMKTRTAEVLIKFEHIWDDEPSPF